MKMFLSWSGNKSHQMALAFSEWIPCVIQAIDPWISSKDVDRGAIWFNEILEQLKEINFGIVFVTKENQNKPWLLFETGALSKGLTENRICTVLVDLYVRDIDSDSPLRHLNHTTLEKDSIFTLVQTINKHLETVRVQDKPLETSFNALWEMFKSKSIDILKDDPDPVSEEPRREDTDVLNDILDNVLNINKKVSRSENKDSNLYIHKKHAKAIIKRLLKMDFDRGNIKEALEDVTPQNGLNEELDGFLGKEEEYDY